MNGFATSCSGSILYQISRRFRRWFRFVAFHVGEWQLFQRGDYSRRLWRSLNTSHSHGRHWILLLHSLFLFPSTGRTPVIGSRYALLRHPFKIVLIPVGRKLRIRVLPLQRWLLSRRRSSVNLLSCPLCRRRRRYIRVRIAGYGRSPCNSRGRVDILVTMADRCLDRQSVHPDVLGAEERFNG